MGSSAARLRNGVYAAFTSGSIVSMSGTKSGCDAGCVARASLESSQTLARAARAPSAVSVLVFEPLSIPKRVGTRSGHAASPAV
eukprot:scaffold152710_cov35-Tisochrysis_lutea.AAC.5